MRPRVTRFFAAVVFAGLAHGAVCAVAGPVARADSAADTAAIALKKFEEGRRAFEAGDFKAALAAFQASLELQPSPNSRLYIGRCHRALGRTASAFTSFRLSAREAQDRLVASGENRYAATRDAANGEAAALEDKVPYITIAVPSDVPSDFEVRVDGTALPRSVWGTALPFDPGSHVVEARGHRVTPFAENVVLRDGDKHRADVRAARVPTATVSVRFESRPSGVAVRVDGEAVDAGSLDRERELDVGAHVVEATAPGYLPFRWEKTLADREEAKVTIKLSPVPQKIRETKSGTPRWMFFGVAATSVVALGGGTYFALRASSLANGETAKDPLQRDPTVRDRVSSQAQTANGFFIAGAALGIGASVLLITTRWRSDEPRGASVGVGPWIGAGAGVTARGTF